jgi:hypothetical protein
LSGHTPTLGREVIRSFTRFGQSKQFGQERATSFRREPPLSDMGMQG